VHLVDGHDWLAKFEEQNVRVGVTLIRPPRVGENTIVGRVAWRPADGILKRDLGEVLVKTGRGVVIEIEDDLGKTNITFDVPIEHLLEDAKYVEKLAELENEAAGEGDDDNDILSRLGATVGKGCVIC